MLERKPSRLRRVTTFVVFRFVPAVLIIACIIFAVQLLQAVFDRINAQITADRQHPAFVQTATALVTSGTLTPSAPEGAQNAGSFQLAAYVNSGAGDVQAQFETNTPLPDVQSIPTAEAPTPVPITPRPLPTLFMYSDAGGGEAGGTAIPSPVPTLNRQGYDLMNILLLGNDGELTDDGFLRTDTMIIVSINRTTNTVAMISLPRDLYVYIPGWTMQRLNLAYIQGERGGWPGGGFGLLRQTILYNFGINVHYFAMVNLTGFKAMVDAVGGVNLSVDCAIEDLPLIGAEVPQGAYKNEAEGDYVLPVGYYSMTGAEALWYARSRHNSSDFDRGRRQQQVLRAVWRKARDTGLLNNVVSLWNEAMQNVQTDLTLEDVLGLVPLALNMDSSQIQDFRLIRTYHTTPWQPPDGSNVQLPVYDPLRQLLQDFYTPPTENQLVVRRSSIDVFNGSGNPNWDNVAADRLAWDGFGAVAMGNAPDSEAIDDTILIDHTGRTKGSSLNDIARTLNVRPENIRVEADPNRTVDYEVILGRNYNSCVEQGILPVNGG